jgi:RNA polymerase sigma-70 factor (ECF subfamily)
MKCNVFNLWTTYRDGLKGYVSKRVADKHDVEDILQSVLIKFANYCETRNDVKNVKAWIYRITQNTIIDFYKKSNRTFLAELETIELPETQMKDESVFIWLHNFIDSLPSKYSIPLRLSDLEGKPQKEIADQLGLTLEAAKSRIQRARKMLREKFDECGIIEHSENQTILFTVTKPCCLT